MKTALMLVLAAVLLREAATRLAPPLAPPPSPNPALEPDAVIRIVAGALLNVNSPRPNSGIFLAYQFASPANKEVTAPYGNFLVGVKHPVFAGLRAPGATAVYGALERTGTTARQTVTVNSREGQTRHFGFELSRQATNSGACPGCWMVDSVIPLDAQP